MSNASPRAGIFQALKNIPLTLLSIGQTRLELLANEFEAQKLAALRMLLLAQALMFCITVGVLAVVALLALLMWEQRIVVVGVCAAVFLLAAVWCYRALMQMVHAPAPAFASTLAELREDMRQLRAATSHAATPD
ncbi:MAG: phage holin family protein [Burkholderiaceae bacterium]